MKNKKGFTLIELLITFAILSIILVIAIVSYLKIKDLKKKEAWNLVEEQIETAANEYFNNNQLDKDVSGYVSVGKLVEEDYLSKVINPITNKAISSCAIVNFTKDENNNYTVSLDENTIDSRESTCNNSANLFVYKNISENQEQPEVDFNVIYTNKNGEEVTPNGNGWFNKSILKGNGTNEEILNVLIDVPNNINVRTVSINNKNIEEKEDNKYKYIQTTDVKSKELVIKVTDSLGNWSSKSITINKDTIIPDITKDEIIYKVFNIAKTPDVDKIYSKTEHSVKLYNPSSKSAAIKLCNIKNNSAYINKVSKISFAYYSDTFSHFDKYKFNFKYTDSSEQGDNEYKDMPKNTGLSNDLDINKNVEYINYSFKDNSGGNNGDSLLNYLSHYDTSGLQIHSKDVDNIKCNHGNYIRAILSCSDSLSGCNKYGFVNNSKVNFNDNRLFISFTEAKLNTFKISDIAGNMSQEISVDTTNNNTNCGNNYICR